MDSLEHEKETVQEKHQRLSDDYFRVNSKIVSAIADINDESRKTELTNTYNFWNEQITERYNDYENGVKDQEQDFTLEEYINHFESGLHGLKGFGVTNLKFK